jgi:hypothetical protein
MVRDMDLFKFQIYLLTSSSGRNSSSDNGHYSPFVLDEVSQGVKLFIIVPLIFHLDKAAVGIKLCLGEQEPKYNIMNKKGPFSK